MTVDKHYIAKGLWVLFFLLTTSCEEFFLKEVEVNDNTIENRLVVQAFISPQDTLIKVEVRYAEPAIGFVPIKKRSEYEVTDAIVTLTDGESKVTLKLTDFEAYYFVHSEEFPIVAGKTYNLEVSGPGYLSASATCTVPINGVDTSKVEVVSVGEVTDQVTLKWKDDSDDTNYYSLFYFSMRDDSLGKTEVGFSYSLGVYTNNPDVGSSIVSRKFRREDTNYYGAGFKSYPLVLIARIDYHYYEFHRTLEEQTTDIEIPSGIPLSVYTNIEGGFGVFAAYNSVLFSFD